MKRDVVSRRSGAALLVTLFLVAAIALIVVSYLAMTRQELAVSGATLSETRAKLGEEAAFAEAGALLRALTSNDRYFVTLASRESGSGPARYTFISTPDADGITHVPLFAGGQAIEGELANLDTLSTDELTDTAVAKPELRFSGETRRDLIELPPLTGIEAHGSLQEGERHPELGTIELPPASDLPYRTRYTYWIEDLEAYPNVDIVGSWTPGESPAAIRYGYPAHDSRVGDSAYRLAGADMSFRFPVGVRGQSSVDQVAPGLSTREILLQTWPINGFPDERHPFRNAARLSTERHWIADSRYPTMDGTKKEPERFSSGLRPYRRVPLIPQGHGYADAGKPRYNLNTLIANRDLTIADIVERNLPDFSNRRGGFPDDEDYVGTLAANAIDYADADSLPALPANVNHAGTRKFRGVDNYCPVNEFFVKFKYVGYEPAGEHDLVVFEATPYVEFWNTSNREASMNNLRLRFRFLERICFRSNGIRHEIEESHRTKDDAFPDSGGLAITVPPNHFAIATFGMIRWKVPVTRPPLVAFPVVQDLRGISNVMVRAHYELFSGTEKMDQCGRPEPDEATTNPTYGFFFEDYSGVLASGEPFMRMALPALAGKAFGFHVGFGSHLGDPWMPWFSRSTGERFTYATKATPGFRNFDHEKVTPGQPDRFKDQTRVRDWPDRGYDDELPTFTAPDDDSESPDQFNHPLFSEANGRAPWRISNLIRYHSPTELGNLHDPVMWIPGPDKGPDSLVEKQTTQRYDLLRNTSLKSLPIGSSPGKMWGGGNTLRIGRPEHERFDQPGMRASQWLDLFHTGVTGTNLGPIEGTAGDLYRHYDPRDHQPPSAAVDPVVSQTEPSSLVYDPDLHAQSVFQLIHGHLNLNTAPTRFEIETLLRGPSVSSDLRLKTDDFKTPVYEREGETGTLRSALKEEAIPSIAEGLMEARPFVSPSHLARVFSELIERHDALPEHHNDAEAEEPFARLFNTTELSSRHFRIYAAAEVYHAETGEIVGRSRGVREVFLRPVHDADGKLRESRLEVISSRDL